MMLKTHVHVCKFWKFYYLSLVYKSISFSFFNKFDFSPLNLSLKKTVENAYKYYNPF